MPRPLTKRQREILNFIERTAAKHGYPPTRAEICTEFGFRSPNAAEDHLRALARKGAIELQGGVSRGITLRQAEPRRSEQLPLIGRVAAGSPLLAVEHIDGHYSVDPALFTPAADYLLRVAGASMIDAGIADGDLVAVHRTGEARNKQIVVARVDDEVTVKRLQVSRKRVRLLPANPDFEPIEVDPARAEFVIEGLVVGIIKNRV